MKKGLFLFFVSVFFFLIISHAFAAEKVILTVDGKSYNKSDIKNLQKELKSLLVENANFLVSKGYVAEIRLSKKTTVSANDIKCWEAQKKEISGILMKNNIITKNKTANKLTFPKPENNPKTLKNEKTKSERQIAVLKKENSGMESLLNKKNKYLTLFFLIIFVAILVIVFLGFSLYMSFQDKIELRKRLLKKQECNIQMETVYIKDSNEHSEEIEILNEEIVRLKNKITEFKEKENKLKITIENINIQYRETDGKLVMLSNEFEAIQSQNIRLEKENRLLKKNQSEAIINKEVIENQIEKINEIIKEKEKQNGTRDEIESKTLNIRISELEKCIEIKNREIAELKIKIELNERLLLRTEENIELREKMKEQERDSNKEITDGKVIPLPKKKTEAS